MPERIQLSRRKGWRMPPNTVKVDRSTKWGNPFRADKDGPGKMPPRDYAAQKCEYLLSGFYCLCARPSVEAQRRYMAMFMRAIPELAGKNLACWCPLGARCHADTLLKAAKVYATKRGERTRQRWLKTHDADGAPRSRESA